jgi:Family of unknown function (DUF6644)
VFLDFARWLGTTPVSIWVQSHLWLTPLLQSIHILMIGIVVVVIMMITLRVLGLVSTDETFAAVWQRYTPWMWTALVIMLTTGVILSIGEPVREASAMSFWVKMCLIVIGVVGVVVFGRTLKPLALVGAAQFSGSAKLVALGTLALWLFIIFLGRAIAYDVEVWESLHLG